MFIGGETREGRSEMYRLRNLFPVEDNTASKQYSKQKAELRADNDGMSY